MFLQLSVFEVMSRFFIEYGYGPVKEKLSHVTSPLWLWRREEVSRMWTRASYDGFIGNWVRLRVIQTCASGNRFRAVILFGVHLRGWRIKPWSWCFHPWSRRCHCWDANPWILRRHFMVVHPCRWYGRVGFYYRCRRLEKFYGVFHVFQALLCNCGVSGGWVAAAMC